MDEYQKTIFDMIKDADFLFDAIQTAGNEAMRQVGYNQPYSITPDITVIYELLDHGPENVHYYDKYKPSPDEYGESIDQSRQKFNSYLRIVVMEDDTVVCCIEGPGVFHMSYHVDGPWEDQLLSWFRADGGILR